MDVHQDPDPDENLIQISSDGDSWTVSSPRGVTRLSSRSEAFEAAKALARELVPSRIEVASAKGGTPGAETPAAEPPSSPPPRNSAVGTTRPIAFTSATAVAGPDALGRSLLVSPGAPAPPPWTDRERIRLDEAALRDPSVLGRLRSALFHRERIVIEIEDGLQAPQLASRTTEVWRLPVDHEEVPEAVWRMATQNAVDARGDGARWRPTELAAGLGAEVGGPCDVLLSDGSAAWCDGGPLTLFDPEVVGGQLLPLRSLELGRLLPLRPHEPSAELAPDQLAAVGDPGLRARIVAPAGSGKTRVLTERARHLIAAGVPAESLLLVAYNLRARRELEARTRDVPGLRIRTFNALGRAIVTGQHPGAPSGRSVTHIDEPEVRVLIKDLADLPRQAANTDPLAAWIDALSAVRLGLRDPEEVEQSFRGDVEGFAEFFPRYRSALARSGKLDFDEQIYGAIELLLRDPDARAAAQQRASVLLVDEFQDLTPAHLLLARLLAGPELAIFGVGDDDQTIYGYSGARPEWLVDFDRFVPYAAEHALTVNYRCPVRVVESASNLLSHNALRVDKTITPGPSAVQGSGSIVLDRSPSPITATLAAVGKLASSGVPASDICVLTRVNSALVPVEVGLAEAGYRVNAASGQRFLRRRGVQAAMAWLRIAIDPGRLGAEDISNAARRPSRGLSPRVIEWMGEQQDVRGLRRLAGRITDERSASRVREFADDVARIAKVAEESATDELVDFIRSGLGLERTLQTLDASHLGRNSAAHSDDLRALAALGELHPEPSSFPAWLAAHLSRSSDEDGITLATVHKVKGLEWPHVIIHDASDGAFPHHLSTDVEEERRVFHVAITRCKESLSIVAEHGRESLFIPELIEAGTPSSPAATDAARHQQSVGELPADPGATFEWGGYRCEVRESGAEGAVVAIGGASTTVAFGSLVVVDGRTMSLVPASGGRRAPGKASSETSLGEQDEALFELLRAWRLERCRADKVAPFIIFADEPLRELARSRPADVASLLRIKGVGPKKVELYGDELLAIIADAS